jgi:hypothetical protein
MVEFGGPGGVMMLGPDAQILRDRIEPLVHDRIERLQNLPERIQLRSPTRIRTLMPARARRVMKVEGLDDGEPQPVTAETIRELVASAIRDAQSALRKLAEDGVV